MRPMEEDLGALAGRLTRRLVALERPLLEARELTMWEYVVLTHLARDAAPTQQALAAAIHYDKTRLIGLLDGLERRGLVSRAPDPGDRRARIVRITRSGRARFAAAQRDVRRMEQEALGELADELRDALALVAARLADRR
jgi:DNA-binding MarR family transcriptional regulator